MSYTDPYFEAETEPWSASRAVRKLAQHGWTDGDGYHRVEHFGDKVEVTELHPDSGETFVLDSWPDVLRFLGY